MKRSFLLFVFLTISILSVMAILGRSNATDGQAIFESLRCGNCHKPGAEKLAVSLTDISKAYGDPAKLVDYMDGKSEPIVTNKGTSVMKGQLKKLANLTIDEKQALAQYLLGFK